MTKFDKRWLANFKEFQLFLNKNHRIPETNEVTTSEGTDLRSWFVRQQFLEKNGNLPEYRNNLITELLSWDLWYEQKITYINSILFLCYNEKLYPSKGYNINVVSMYKRGAISYNSLKRAIKCDIMYLSDFCKRFNAANIDIIIKCFSGELPSKETCVLYCDVCRISSLDFVFEIIEKGTTGINKFINLLQALRIEENNNFKLLYLYYFKHYSHYYLANHYTLRLFEVMSIIKSQVNNLRKAYFKEDILKTSRDIEISHLNLSPRLENILHRSGFFKLSELEFLVKEVKSKRGITSNILKNRQMFKKGFGENCVNELSDVLWNIYCNNKSTK